MISSIPGAGLLGSSEGRVADDGVFNAGSVGLGERGVLMVGIAGVGVGEDDGVGDADDESDPSVADEGGDDASDEASEGMMVRNAVHTTESCCQSYDLRSNDGNACGGQ